MAGLVVQAQDSYVVVGDKVHMRRAPTATGVLMGQLEKGRIVGVLETASIGWYKVRIEGAEGYVAAKWLLPIEEVEATKHLQKVYAATGDNPDCDNITPAYDATLDNVLRIKVGVNADVVVKLMTLEGNECIRIAYVKAGDTYRMENIPENKYYVKVAYGKDLRKSNVEGQCKVQFLLYAMYEKGSDALDFRKWKQPNTWVGGTEYENWQLPSYELSLNVVYSQKPFANQFSAKKISEREFNQ
ncbi:hypothetical protein BUE76_01330 [Cnuella takakiae]|nr:hypothetical protein BUE76_01330 [Cnuella takakiae]